MIVIPDGLKAGDAMFYSPSAWYGKLICVLSGGWCSHVEICMGKGLSLAARTEGYNLYAVRVDRYLRSIRRPNHSFNRGEAWRAVWHDMGKPYEFIALPRFLEYWRRSRHVARVCSPMATKLLIGGGCHPFQPEVDLSRVTPYDLWSSAEMHTVWSS